MALTYRTTVNDLRNKLVYLNKLTGGDYTIDKNTGGYRLVNKGGSHDVSPRLPAGEMERWLHAFIDGVEIGKGLAS